MRISFDFDSTLSQEIIQKLAKILVLANTDVWIVTSRFSDPNVRNYDLHKVADEVGIPVEKRIFTNGDYKWRKLQELNVDLHFDDMEDEVYLINKNGGRALLVDLDVSLLKYLFDDLIATGELTPEGKIKR